MTELAVQVETSFANLNPLRQEWDRLVLESGSDLYMSFDYCRLWWEVFGLKRKLRVFLFRDQGRLVGALPLLIDPIRLGPIRFRLARVLGSDLVREMFIPAVLASHADEIYCKTLQRLFGEDRCEALVWGCYSRLMDTSDSLRKACGLLAGQVRLVRDKTQDFPHANLYLPATFEDYLTSLDRDRRKDIRRNEKRLREIEDYEVRVTSDAESAVAEFPIFRDLYDRYNRSKGRPGHFAGDPLREKFWLRLCEELGPKGGLRFLHLENGQGTIAYEYSLKFGNAYHWKYRACVFGIEWTNCGVGTVALKELVKKAIEEGVTRVEAGPGHFDYKVRYGATESPIGSILLVADSQTSLFRFRLFEKLVALLDFAYLKLWIWRVRRKLPLSPKARLKLWYRTRL